MREILGAAASEVEQEEDEHLNWTRKKLGELQMEALSQRRKVRGQIGQSESKITDEKKPRSNEPEAVENLEPKLLQEEEAAVERLDRDGGHERRRVTKGDTSRSCR